MNWLIYGDIMENHVVESLVEEFENIGEIVYRLPSLRRDHTISYDIENDVFERIQKFIEDKHIDALFNFRAAELTPKTVEMIKSKGIKTFVWFPDDPLLFEICYKHIANNYDVTLHCGAKDVLEFYERKLGVKGVLFPFWTNDSHFNYSYNPYEADIEVGFLGNCVGKAKADRYDVLAKIPYNTKIFGNLEKGQEDYAKIHAGVIQDFNDIPKTIQRFKIGINFAQKFTNLQDTKYYFDGLKEFNEFYFPSRIIQYSGIGIPIINITESKENIMPSIITVSSSKDLNNVLDELLKDDMELMKISKSIRKDFDKFLSAKSRVELLIKLYKEDHTKYSISKRATLWRNDNSILGKIKSFISF